MLAGNKYEVQVEHQTHDLTQYPIHITEHLNVTEIVADQHSW